MNSRIEMNDKGEQISTDFVNCMQAKGNLSSKKNNILLCCLTVQPLFMCDNVFEQNKNVL